MLDQLFFISLVLNATGLFRFFAPQLGVAIGDVTFAMMIFHLLYLLARMQYVNVIFPKLFFWFLFFIIWPLASVLYAPAVEMREIGLAVYYFLLFFGTVVFVVTNGLPAIRRLLFLCLILTILGQVMSMLMPEYFLSVSELAAARVLPMGRPGGFHLQPNSLAANLVLLFICRLAFTRRDAPWREPVGIVLLLAAVLFTGSRSGILLSVFIVLAHYFTQWRVQLFHSHRTRHFALRLVILIALFVVGIVGVKVVIDIYGDRIERRPHDLLDRMETMLTFRLSARENLTDDASLSARMGAQAIYWSYIREKPLAGYGFGSETYALRRGDFYRTAHSAMLSLAFQMGLLYPLAFILLISSLLLSHRRKAVQNFLSSHLLTIFVLVSLLFFAGDGGLFERRLFHIVLGLVFSLAWYPHLLLRQDPETRQFIGVFSRRDIRRNWAEGTHLETHSAPVAAPSPAAVAWDAGKAGPV